MLVSEYATKNRFTIVTVKAFRAFIIKEGSPKIIIFVQCSIQNEIQLF